MSKTDLRNNVLRELMLNIGYAHNFEWAPDLMSVLATAQDYRTELEVAPASDDTLNPKRMRTNLLIVNPQRDFACTKGALYNASRNPEGVTQTVTKFIYQNVEEITRITPTLTNHFPFQIMFAAFWVDSSGKHPEPGAEVTAESVDEGVWAPNPAMALWLCRNEYDWLVKQCKHYCEKLEELGRMLVIKPPHCMHGSPGYSIVGCIEEARMFHAWVRQIQAECEVNGSNPLAENYSFLGPAVASRKDGEGAVGWKNIRALASQVICDNLILAGHFGVEETAKDIIELLGPEKEQWPCKLYYVRGGTVDVMPDEYRPIDSFDDIPPLEDDNGEE